MAKTIAAVAIIGSTLGACADHAVTPPPTIEYRVPPPTATFARPPTPVVASTDLAPPEMGDKENAIYPPPCDCDGPGAPSPTPTPIPIATPAPVTVESQSVGGSLNDTLIAAGWPSYLLPWARAITWRESNDQPWVTNASSGAMGLFQVMPSTWAEMACVGDPYSAFDNARCAWELYQVAGVSPWRLN